MNVVEFGENNFDETEITWPDTIPLGENPLVYDEGIHVVGLEDDRQQVSMRRAWAHLENCVPRTEGTRTQTQRSIVLHVSSPDPLSAR